MFNKCLIQCGTGSRKKWKCLKATAQKVFNLKTSFCKPCEESRWFTSPFHLPKLGKSVIAAECNGDYARCAGYMEKCTLPSSIAPSWAQPPSLSHLWVLKASPLLPGNSNLRGPRFSQASIMVCSLFFNSQTYLIFTKEHSCTMRSTSKPKVHWFHWFMVKKKDRGL